MLIGYARVSTDEQNLSLQRDALNKAGCKRIFTDTASGAPTKRPGLADALSHLRKGDSLVVWKLDRLERSVKGLVTGSEPFPSVTCGIPCSSIAIVTHVTRRCFDLSKRLAIFRSVLLLISASAKSSARWSSAIR
jgi:DNA invertase Pin-like site-specific DNA recombinase